MISNILLMLAMHQDVQQRVVDELTEIDLRGDDFSDESLGQMKYLEMVIKECLRLFPLPAVSVRYAAKDLQLSKPPNGTFKRFSYNLSSSGSFAADWNNHFIPNALLSNIDASLGTGCSSVQSRPFPAGKHQRRSSIRLHSVLAGPKKVHRIQIRLPNDENLHCAHD